MCRLHILFIFLLYHIFEEDSNGNSPQTYSTSECALFPDPHEHYHSNNRRENLRDGECYPDKSAHLRIGFRDLRINQRKREDKQRLSAHGNDERLNPAVHRLKQSLKGNIHSREHEASRYNPHCADTKLSRFARQSENLRERHGENLKRDKSRQHNNRRIDMTAFHAALHSVAA